MASEFGESAWAELELRLHALHHRLKIERSVDELFDAARQEYEDLHKRLQHTFNDQLDYADQSVLLLSLLDVPLEWEVYTLARLLRLSCNATVKIDHFVTEVEAALGKLHHLGIDPRVIGWMESTRQGISDSWEEYIRFIGSVNASEARQWEAVRGDSAFERRLRRMTTFGNAFSHFFWKTVPRGLQRAFSCKRLGKTKGETTGSNDFMSDKAVRLEERVKFLDFTLHSKYEAFIAGVIEERASRFLRTLAIAEVRMEQRLEEKEVLFKQIDAFREFAGTKLAKLVGRFDPTQVRHKFQQDMKAIPNRVLESAEFKDMLTQASDSCKGKETEVDAEILLGAFTAYVDDALKLVVMDKDSVLLQWENITKDPEAPDGEALNLPDDLSTALAEAKADVKEKAKTLFKYLRDHRAFLDQQEPKPTDAASAWMEKWCCLEHADVHASLQGRGAKADSLPTFVEKVTRGETSGSSWPRASIEDLRAHLAELMHAIEQGLKSVESLRERRESLEAKRKNKPEDGLSLERLHEKTTALMENLKQEMKSQHISKKDADSSKPPLVTQVLEDILQSSLGTFFERVEERPSLSRGSTQ